MGAQESRSSSSDWYYEQVRQQRNDWDLLENTVISGNLVDVIWLIFREENRNGINQRNHSSHSSMRKKAIEIARKYKHEHIVDALEEKTSINYNNLPVASVIKE